MRGMNSADSGELRFGRVIVRPALRSVLVDGKPVAFGARALDVLFALVEHRDRLVTKEELLDYAWPGLVVEENNLQVQISALRKVLGANAIATVPARGYRLTLALDSEDAQPAPVPRYVPGVGVTDDRIRQRVRYLSASDGLRLAWAEAGTGPTLVKAANWLTHLEYEWDSPVWKHWIRFFSQHWRFVRYDERGCGMSDWSDDSLTLEQWTHDLQSVIDIAQPSGPVTLIGISQGAATSVNYAVRHPERVERLILYGGFARGRSLRKGILSVDPIFRGIVELAKVAWASDNWTFRQIFTSRFIPGGTDEQLRWFNELCLKSTSGQIAARLVETRDVVDVTGLLRQVHVPTLVLHARNDELVPVEEGRLLATEIPGAEFVEVDSRNHVLLEAEPAWGKFCEAVLTFCQ
jgi:pimeloyl-ACP methyl ester carboxylesterase/DNA-binding winged helix-turn-helix (wHTH) protein